MNMENGQERLFRQLLSTHRCGNCRHRFERDRFSIMAKHEKLWVVSAHCSACNKVQVFWVSLNRGIAGAARAAPTRSENGWRRFRSSTPMTFLRCTSSFPALMATSRRCLPVAGFSQTRL